MNHETLTAPATEDGDMTTTQLTSAHALENIVLDNQCHAPSRSGL